MDTSCTDNNYKTTIFLIEIKQKAETEAVDLLKYNFCFSKISKCNVKPNKFSALVINSKTTDVKRDILPDILIHYNHRPVHQAYTF